MSQAASTVQRFRCTPAARNSTPRPHRTGFPLTAIAGVDADVVSREVACPYARSATSRAQVHDDRNVRGEQLAMRGALAEGMRASIAAHQNTSHTNFDARGIESNARPAGCGQDSAPVGIPAGKRRLNE